MAEMVQDVTVALDWTPNTNHVGFYVAKALGYYANLGLSVHLRSPHLDSYSSTPASKVAEKTATFALAPSETVLSYSLPPLDPQRSKLTAIATVLQQDLSAIATLKKGLISRPQELDGSMYASYGARFEGRIVQKLIQADGGKGEFVEITPPKLGIWDTVVAGTADATWIFKGWEGIEAQLQKIELNEFSLTDYGIPYGYSPLIVSRADTLKSQPNMVKNFLRATGEGFVYAAANVDQASNILTEIANRENASMPKMLDPELVLQSLKYLSKYFLNDSGNWGFMVSDRWKNFVEWLSAEGLLTTLIQSRKPMHGISVSLDELRSGNAGDVVPLSELNSQEVFTNEYLT